jgi:hypothetical protein
MTLLRVQYCMLVQVGSCLLMTTVQLVLPNVVQQMFKLTLLYVPASVRLLPAGFVVVAWASSRGKPLPNTAAAWLACAVFGLVDGTLFQGEHCKLHVIPLEFCFVTCTALPRSTDLSSNTAGLWHAEF